MTTVSVWSLVVSGLVTGAPEPASVGVLVRSGPPAHELPDAQRKDRERLLSARYKDEYKEWERLEKDLKKQFGKKVDKWPEEKQRALRAAHERVEATDAEILFLKVDPNYADSAADIRRHVEASKGVHVVDKSEDAHLVVEILARKGSFGPRARNRVLCRISLGAKAKARRPQPKWDSLEWPGRRYSSEGERIVLHSYSSKEPWWSFLEAERNAWRAVAAWVAEGLNDFVKQNASALTGAPTPKR